LFLKDKPDNNLLISFDLSDRDKAFFLLWLGSRSGSPLTKKLLNNLVLLLLFGLLNLKNVSSNSNCFQPSPTGIIQKREGIIFLLWGKFAQGKEILINAQKHSILKAAHPSPLARRAFFGCKHFSKTNDFLIKSGKSPINWNIE